PHRSTRFPYTTLFRSRSLCELVAGWCRRGHGQYQRVHRICALRAGSGRNRVASAGGCLKLGVTYPRGVTPCAYLLSEQEPPAERSAPYCKKRTGTSPIWCVKTGRRSCGVTVCDLCRRMAIEPTP